MGQIKVEKNVGGIAGLCVIEPAVHGDARGYFMETYSQRDTLLTVFLCSVTQQNSVTSAMIFIIRMTKAVWPGMIQRLVLNGRR